MQVVDLGGDALQCSSVIAHGGASVWGFKEIVKIIPGYIRVRPSRAPSVGRCFQVICQLAIQRQIEAIDRYILVDQTMIGQLYEQIMLAKDGVFNDMVAFKDDVTGRHLSLLPNPCRDLISPVSQP
ncbi:hypothetical protein CAI18_14525 [Xanthomonas citri pv. punicae]|nr:hypothetical protein XapA_12495 [Xanthomonas citri pv. punicae]QCZ82131.1 hypothetical protein XapB_15985 [Xanthomonas citri pv. punicae]QCZ86059.1 hypothetical protein CAI18_14525 [Xanthomonas citri pv. punicae]QCZ90455.1 hypothetical protein DOO79_16700 [Xanthomonas citri pv. punicae]